MCFHLRQRLRHTYEFEAVRRKGRKCVGPFFILQLLETEPSSRNPKRFLGVIASRRIGKAVHRNRAKRLLREVFRLNPRILPKNCAVVLTARKAIFEASFEAIQRDYKRMVKKIASSPTY